MCFDHEIALKQKIKNRELEKESMEVQSELEKVEEQPMVTSAN
ncbi:MAG TPA: hypothetical protein VE818_14215 [Nitrososphaeraceae archaeon]|jgi:hypothetical protein|nr:hypothetical protein [Nitrososphaeraceae archaeon]